ncbi:RNA-binding domain-containing protein [Acidilobus saccharovorans]|uniref:RNA-binding domain-containing protein n=1 Tax=Acidilobus saccharovorans TaxID=242703 RepID=UPI000A072151|nr:RNA-binding domain-containing protein [Acidilobus saccharovorans]
MRVRSLEARVYVHATENEEKVIRALHNLIGSSNIVVEELRGYFGNPITVVSTSKEKEEAEEAFNRMISMLTEPDRRFLLSSLEERVDKEGSLHLRFDKQKAYLGKVVLSDSDDVIKVRVRFFRESREQLIEELRSEIEGLKK